MEKYKIEMRKDEMIRYYANKIVEDGIKECLEFSNTVDINNYDNIEKFKNEILERIYRDNRVSDVYLDEEGNFDMDFYTDYCPYYYDDSLIDECEYDYNLLLKKDLLEDFRDYYYKECLWSNPYISIRELLDRIAEKNSLLEERRVCIKYIIKKILVESKFIENNIDGIEVYITPKNYKELEKVIDSYIEQNIEESLEI